MTVKGKNQFEKRLISFVIMNFNKIYSIKRDSEVCIGRVIGCLRRNGDLALVLFCENNSFTYIYGLNPFDGELVRNEKLNSVLPLSKKALINVQ